MSEPRSAAPDAPVTLADHGAGKSYLGFMLYDLLLARRPGHVYGIETRGELVERSRALATRLGFERMSFLHLSVAEAIEDAQLPPRIDIVTALHACAMHALLPPARVLLSRGADRNAADAFGRTAADVARQLGYVDIAHELAARSSAIPSVRQTLRQPAQPSD